MTETVFGEEYAGLEGATLALLVASLLGTATGSVHPWLQARRRTLGIVLPGLLAAAVDITLCVALIPEYPLVGAIAANCLAGATLIASAFLTAGFSREALRGAAALIARGLVPLGLWSALSLVSYGLAGVPRAAAALLLCLLTARLVLPALQILPEQDAALLVQGERGRL